MSDKLKYSVMVAIAAASNGLLSCIVKLAVNNGVALANFLVGSSFLGLLSFLILQKINRQKLPQGFIFIKLFAIGLLFGLSAFMFTSAVENLPASIAVVLQFQFVWIGVVLDSIYRKCWPSKSNWIVVIMILVGTIFAAGLLDISEESLYLSGKGIFFGLSCACCFAGYLFANDHVLPDIDWKTRSFCVMTGAFTFILFIIFPLLAITSKGSIFININFAYTLFYSAIMALFGYVICIAFFAIGIPKIGSTISSILSSFELPVAIIGAMLLLNENVSTLQWIGIIIIVISLLLPQTKNT